MSELKAAAERVRADAEPGQRWAVTAGALAIVVLLSAIDASWDEIFAATVVIGPFLAALAASERQTAGVAVAAVAAALLSGIWNDNAGDAAYFVRAAVVVAGGAFSVLAARRRVRATRAEAIGEQLTAALSNLAEAVVVQSEDRSLIYANEAAAETLGFASAEALLSAAPGELIDNQDYFTEDGAPLGPEQFPSMLVLKGEEPGPVTVRVVNRATGEERWRVTKARGVHDGRGRPRLVVSVVEDITEGGPSSCRRSRTSCSSRPSRTPSSSS